MPYRYFAYACLSIVQAFLEREDLAEADEKHQNKPSPRQESSQTSSARNRT